MDLKTLNNLTETFGKTDRMPLFFLGHGNPMNAIEENDFVEGFRNAGQKIKKPAAIICVSAHWETKGTFVTAMQRPRTIHDFRGFPMELYEVQYPVYGSPELAAETKKLIHMTEVGLDDKWGLDHGAWSVLKHLYPDADVPVIQMSLDYTKPAMYHYELAKEIAVLRQRGVLIVGSGNMIHNLGLLAWDKLNGEAFAFDWAEEADEKMKSYILKEDFQNLIDFEIQDKAFDLAIPTPEHYLPLIYILALKVKEDDTKFFNDKIIGGSLSMTSLKFE